MIARPVIDASKFPLDAVGQKAPLWWGTVLMIAIESMAFALVIASYFFIRMRYPEWPPPDAAPPSLLVPGVNLAVLIVSFVPQYLIDMAVESQDKDRLQRLLIYASVLGILACVLRYWDFRALNTMWYEHSYGSVVWALVFLHSIHLAASTLETVLMALFVSRAPLDEKHRSDLNVNAVYWFFVVISWVVIFSVIWGGARVL